MQLLVLGMHRGGTSTAARLLNMMGAHFVSSSDAIMAANENNEKGYWERRDVWELHEKFLRRQQAGWHVLSHFDVNALQAELAEQESELTQELKTLIYGLDAHRPWFIKDPRLNLLLPLWREHLEVPVCVFVHRNPMQIAQSLKKRNGFPIQLGLALWERYALDSLRYSQGLPRIAVSYHELMSEPVASTQRFYEALTAHEVQGLRLPSEREILAFIDLNLQHQQGSEQALSAYANQQQLNLNAAWQSGEVWEWDEIPALSAGAQEVLLAHDEMHHLQFADATCQKRLSALETSLQEVRSNYREASQNLRFIQAEKDSLEKNLNTLRADAQKHEQLKTTHQKLVTELERSKQAQQQLRQAQEQSNAKLHSQLTSAERRLQHSQSLNRQLINLVEATLASFSWRLGKALRRLSLQNVQTVEEHFLKLKNIFQQQQKDK